MNTFLALAIALAPLLVGRAALGVLLGITSAELTPFQPCWRDDLRCLFTATPYAAVSPSSQASSAGAIPAACVPVHVVLVARHGSRFMTEKSSTKLSRLVATLRAAARAGEIESLPAFVERWAPPDDQWGELAPLGELELRSLGARLRALLKWEALAAERVRLRWTRKNRTRSSAVAFVGAFLAAEGEAERAVARGAADDKLLRFFDGCARYEREQKNRSLAAAADAFAASAQMTAARDGLGAALGRRRRAGQPPALSAEDVVLVAKACSLDLVASRGCATASWCSLLLRAPGALAAADRLEDLRKFARCGQAAPINYMVAAELAQDIFRSLFGAAAANGSSAGADLLFAHAETLLPLLAALSLPGEALDAPRAEQRASRGGHAGGSHVGSMCQLSPYAANLALVLYRCERNAPAQHLRVLLNERDVVGQLGGCAPLRGTALCPLHTVAAHPRVREALAGYGFESVAAMCESRSRGTSDGPPAVTLAQR